ncbi:hypothetical protein FRC11_000265 [Ceratobasidium sp. 423]|nr:hypothetical protein FRC11_000265 [Ceratobasidium sp. 423]
MQFPPGNALGLELPTNPPVAPIAVGLPSSMSSASTTYYAGTPHPSGYVQALTSDMLSVDLPNVDPSPSFENSHAPPNDPVVWPLPSLPSPRFPLRSVPPTVAQSTQPQSTGSARPLPPDLSARPRLMVRLPAPSKRGAGQRRKPRKRKRVEQASSEDSGEEEGVFHAQENRVRPNMLLTSLHTAPTNIQSATQHLAIVRPVPNNSDSDEEMNDRRHPISEGDAQVVESLYEEQREGGTADLRTLCDLVHKLLGNQAELTRSVKQIDTRTRQMATNRPNPSTEGGAYVSPPEPTLSVNWDQNIQYDAPAGRRRRAERRVLIMGLIHETIFRLLSRRSVHDPLPPPPPPSLRAPTEINFAFRWQESYKSIFNQSAANIVVQKIMTEKPGMLSANETEELPTMVSKHIQYLCRCYKEQNREDAEDFNTQRRNRCGAGTRKRQVCKSM